MHHSCASPFTIFKKFCIFSLVFSQNFSSQDAKFQNFRSSDPLFLKENPSYRPYFSKPMRHIPTKKKLSTPSPPGFEMWMICSIIDISALKKFPFLVSGCGLACLRLAKAPFLFYSTNLVVASVHSLLDTLSKLVCKHNLVEHICYGKWFIAMGTCSVRWQCLYFYL